MNPKKRKYRIIMLSLLALTFLWPLFCFTFLQKILEKAEIGGGLIVYFPSIFFLMFTIIFAFLAALQPKNIAQTVNMNNMSRPLNRRTLLLVACIIFFISLVATYVFKEIVFLFAGVMIAVVLFIVVLTKS